MTSFLPHRPPFLFLDRITSMETGVSAEGVKMVTLGEGSSFSLLEGMAQIAGLAVGVGSDGGFLAALDQVQLLRAVQVGDVLVLKGRVAKSFGNLHLVEASAEVDGVFAASGLLTVGIGKL